MRSKIKSREVNLNIEFPTSNNDDMNAPTQNEGIGTSIEIMVQVDTKGSHRTVPVSVGSVTSIAQLKIFCGRKEINLSFPIKLSQK